MFVSSTGSLPVCLGMVTLRHSTRGEYFSNNQCVLLRNCTLRTVFPLADPWTLFASCVFDNADQTLSDGHVLEAPDNKLDFENRSMEQQ